MPKRNPGSRQWRAEIVKVSLDSWAFERTLRRNQRNRARARSLRRRLFTVGVIVSNVGAKGDDKEEDNGENVALEVLLELVEDDSNKGHPSPKPKSRITMPPTCFYVAGTCWDHRARGDYRWAWPVRAQKAKQLTTTGCCPRVERRDPLRFSQQRQFKFGHPADDPKR